MRSFRIFALLAVFFLASCGHTPHEWSLKMPSILSEMKESVFVIIAFSKERAGSGNAFMIEHGALMTAGHVCEVAGAGAPIYLMKDKKVYTGRVAWIDEDADICIIESDVPGSPLPMLREVPDYDLGYAVSYTRHGVGPPQFKLFVRELRVRNELPAPSRSSPDGIGKRLFLDGQFQAGDSGSPIFNHDGYVIGVLSATGMDNPNDTVGNGIAIVIDPRTCYGVYCDYLESKKERVPMPLPLPSPPEGVRPKLDD